MHNKVLITISLCILPLWWIFQVLWLPSTMQLLGKLAVMTETPNVSEQTATLARARAFEYATRGGSRSEDLYFTQDEVSHLVDVSNLYNPISLTLNFLAIVSWSVLFLAIYKKVDIRSALELSFRILTGLLIALSTCLLLFPFFFEKFHELLFPQGNWSFPADSLLIQIFPVAFWQFEVVTILFLLILFIVLFRLLARKLIA